MNDSLKIIYDGLFYSGDILLTTINYLMIFITLLPFLLTSLKKLVPIWKIVFIFAFFVQASFWFLLNAQGVSIVWNALFGLILISVYKYKNNIQKKDFFRINIAITASVLSNIFFAFKFPIITTVAHISAVLMGIVLFFTFSRSNTNSNEIN